MFTSGLIAGIAGSVFGMYVCGLVALGYNGLGETWKYSFWLATFSMVYSGFIISSFMNKIDKPHKLLLLMVCAGGILYWLFAKFLFSFGADFVGYSLTGSVQEALARIAAMAILSGILGGIISMRLRLPEVDW